MFQGRSAPMALLGLLVLASSLLGAERIWHHSPILIGPNHEYVVNIENCALAMRQGQTWPVVGCAANNGGADKIVAMTPMGWNLEVEMPGDSSPWMVTATSDQGQIAFATNSTLLLSNGQGWSQIGDGAYDVAFAGNGMLGGLSYESGQVNACVYNGLGWVSNGMVMSGVSAAGLTYDSQNQANVMAFVNGNRLWYGTKSLNSALDWQMTETDLYLSEGVTRFDMVMTDNDVPWGAVGSTNRNLLAVTFDIQTNAWVSDYVDDLHMSNTFTLLNDSKNGVGIAYVDNSDRLKYAYNDGSGWLTEVVALDCTGKPGLAFDMDDNPVISYYDQGMQGLMLAYDPIVVPEPASVLLLAGVGLFVRGRRKC